MEEKQMKTLALWIGLAATVGVGAAPALMRKSAPDPAAAPQAAVQQTQPQQARGPAIPIAPTVPEFQAFGQIHVNGQVALESGPATGSVMVGGIPCCRHRIFKTGAWPLIEVHRVLAEDGSAVFWWAVLLDAKWQPANLGGTDYQCSGGGFNVTP
jgi:hypothetical protein